jgi:Mg2+ and Co2+ transporter CorA
LHPLTLEDVLQQDPREKLDTFDILGYYFVVVRALDEAYFKYTPGSPNNSVALVGSPPSTSASPDLAAQSAEKKEGRRRGWGMGRAVGKLAAKTGEKVEIVEDNPGREGLEGVGVGAINVYLVVFADGIVSVGRNLSRC